MAAWPGAAALGLLVGAGLFVAITGTRPRLQGRDAWTPALVGRVAFLGLWATNEEVLWRRVVLGEILSAGTAQALVVSTVGFALVHRRRRLVHLGTGCVFAMLYVGTGALVASIAAHWAYNVLVGVLVDRSRVDVAAAT
jgi:membrane protease YdiL (CAAX protease family)